MGELHTAPGGIDCATLRASAFSAWTISFEDVAVAL